MMNIPPSEAKRLTLWEYQALLHNWNRAHSTGDDIKAPDPERTQRMIDRINANPALTGPKPVPA